MASKTAYQFFHDEQIKLIKNRSSKSHSELQKEIGSKWTAMKTKEKQPYEAMKKEYDAQYEREQAAMKAARSKKSGALASNNNNRSLSSISENSKTRNASANQSSQSSAASSNPKFTKENLQKKIVETSKKVIAAFSQTSNKAKPAAAAAQEQSQIAPKSNQQKQAIETKPQRSAQEDDASNESSHKTYLEFYAKQFAKYRRLYPQREGKELTKVIGNEWKLMKLSLKLKQKQSKENQKSHKRQGGSGAAGGGSQGSKKGFITIEGQEVEVPSKPLSGYMRFYQANYKLIKADNPDMGSNQIAAVASKDWNGKSEQEKAEFDGPYQEERITFERKKTDFIKKYGFFPSSSSRKNNSAANHKGTEKNALKAQTKALNQTNANLNEKSNKAPLKNTVTVRGGLQVQVPQRLSGYYLFEKTLRAQMKEKEHNMSSRELSAFIGTHWKKFPEENKQEYESQQDREFQKQKAAFVARYGSFPVIEKQLKGAAAASKAAAALKVNTAVKPLNGKRPAPQSKMQQPAIIVSKPQLSIEEQEANLSKRIDRKNKINYDDVESEIEDIMDCINTDAKYQQHHHHDGDSFQQQLNMKYKKLKPNHNDNIEKLSASKSRNSLFDMLNEPIQIPDYTFGPTYF